MESLIIVIHILSAVAIVGLVLIQQGKGADMGASFGSGASQTIFGSAGTGNVLTKSTTWLAVMFFITSLSLAVVARNKADAGIEVESLLANPDAAAAAASPVSDLPVVPAEVPADAAVDLAVDLPAAGAVAGDIPAGEVVQAVDAATDAGGAAAETPAPAAETVIESGTQSSEN